MSAVKGERIATNLLGRVVAPRSEYVDAWPKSWPELPPGGPSGTSGRLAEIVAVFVVEGRVHFLVRNLVNGHLNQQSLAEDWKVVR